MTSTLCTNCSAVMSELWTQHDVDRFNIVISPDTCPICASIATNDTYSEDRVRKFERARYIVEKRSSDAANLYMECFSDGGNGFKVWFDIVPSDGKYYMQLSYFTGLKKCLGSNFQIQGTPSTDPLSRDAIAFLITKLKECLTKHPDCCRSTLQNRGKYPTRLLNLRSRTRSRIVLEDTNENREGHYISLLHCWGRYQPMKLTRQSVSRLRRGIQLNELPPTYHDAIEVCRLLDVTCIWINSMCIFQDDISDWNAQAGSMSEVYASALCNIAATNASDVSVGLRINYHHLAAKPFELSAPEKFWDGESKPRPRIKYLVLSHS